MPRASATQHELARVELLAGLPGETLQRLGQRMEREEVAPGTVIVREGDPGDRFYVVVAGMLTVNQRDLGNLGVLRPGDYFGEVALAMSMPRTAMRSSINISAASRHRRVPRGRNRRRLPCVRGASRSRIASRCCRASIACGSARARSRQTKPSSTC